MLQSGTWDGFDNLTATSQLNTSTGRLDTTSYSHASLGRMVSRTYGYGPPPLLPAS
jgi:hypothetical protein